MKTLRKLGGSLLAGLLLSVVGCGGGSNDSDHVRSNTDAFVVAVQSVASTSAEHSEPVSVDALVATAPEDSEPVSL
jgi:hypothetical protein